MTGRPLALDLAPIKAALARIEWLGLLDDPRGLHVVESHEACLRVTRVHAGDDSISGHGSIHPDLAALICVAVNGAPALIAEIELLTSLHPSLASLADMVRSKNEALDARDERIADLEQRERDLVAAVDSACDIAASAASLIQGAGIDDFDEGKYVRHNLRRLRAVAHPEQAGEPTDTTTKGPATP